MYNKLIYYTFYGLVFILLFLFITPNVLAQEYVLPYPGFMPGHPLYKISQVADKIEEFWSFGSFAKFKYHLSMADKKLIEVKTLFEYRQYLLASQAIPQYEHHLTKASAYLREAEHEGKNISEKRKLLDNALAKYKEILEKLKKELPASFVWTPEKKEPTKLEIGRILEKAIEIGRESRQK